VDCLKWGADLAGLLSAFGANQLTSAIGEGKMISTDTGTWTLLAYAQAAGNPPTTTAAVLYSAVGSSLTDHSGNHVYGGGLSNLGGRLLPGPERHAVVRGQPSLSPTRLNVCRRCSGSGAKGR